MKSISKTGIKSKIIFGMLLFLGAFIHLSNGYCATITVKQLGGGDYTTISAAINAALPDDTIVVHPGRYYESLIINKNLNLVGMGPQLTTLYSNSTGIYVNSNMIVKIYGFAITASNDGIYLSTGTNSIIKNNCIFSNGRNGIYGVGTNIISNIINNVIAFNGNIGINYPSTYYADVAQGYFFNNIIYNNTGCGINWTRQFSISHNNAFGNMGGAYCGNITNGGTGAIATDPAFINASLGNFILRNESTSRNAGRPGSGDIDPDGSRNDMGAYGGPDSAPFWPYPLGAPIITELTISPQTVNKGQTITINARGEVN